MQILSICSISLIFWPFWQFYQFRRFSPFLSISSIFVNIHRFLPILPNNSLPFFPISFILVYYISRCQISAITITSIPSILSILYFSLHSLCIKVVSRLPSKFFARISVEQMLLMEFSASPFVRSSSAPTLAQDGCSELCAASFGPNETRTCSAVP